MSVATHSTSKAFSSSHEPPCNTAKSLLLISHYHRPPHLLIAMFVSRGIASHYPGVRCDGPGTCDGAMSTAARREAQVTVKRMFYHGYDSYMKYAFPHDELKPITKSWTDSLGRVVQVANPCESIWFQR